MTAFLLIAGFPIVLGVGFGGMYLVADALGRRHRLDVVSLYLYPALLAIPLAAVALVVGRRDLLAETGLAAPRIGTWETAPSLAVSVALGIVSGAALFYNELHLSGLLLRLTRKQRGLQRALEGQTQVFAQRQQSASIVPILVVSLFVVFAEELLWRGYLLHFLQETWDFSTVAAVLLSSVLFGVNHYYFGLRNVFFKAFSGAVWALLLLWTGSLVAPVLSHYTFECFVWRRLER